MTAMTQVSKKTAEGMRETPERKSVEDELRASLKEIGDLKAALDEHAIVAITDPQGRITYVNDKFCAISKYSREELLGQDHRIINSGLHSPEFFRELWATIARGKVWHGEIRNRAKDGVCYWVETTIVPFLDDRGKPRQYVAIRADITERKRVEATIRTLNEELEKRVKERTAELTAANRELEAFSYSVSHDLRAPLRAIDGYSRVLIEDYEDALDDDGRRLLGVVRSEAQRMGQLIDALLDFSRIGRRKMEPRETDMRALAQAAFEEASAQEPRGKTCFEIAALPAAYGEPVMLRQIWANLLANAVKFTRHFAAPRIEVGTASGNGEVVYFVRDNGAGFDMAHAANLFGVFQRLHGEEEFEGTGVGLAFVKRIVQRHGGRVWAEGIPGQGATFYFTLPRQPIPEPKA